MFACFSGLTVMIKRCSQNCLRAVFMTPYLDRIWIISQFLIAFALSVPMICDNSIHPTSHEYGSELPSFALRTRKFRNLAKPGVALQNDARSYDDCPNNLTSRLAKPLVTTVPFSTSLFTYILPNSLEAAREKTMYKLWDMPLTCTALIRS